MTDLQNHIAAVAAMPFDKAAALALVDHFQEAAGYSRWTALRKVAAVRRPGQDAHFIDCAASLFASNGKSLLPLFDLIYAATNVVPLEAMPVYIISGFTRPHVMESCEDEDHSEAWYASISVGARWILARYHDGLRHKKRWALDLAKAEWLPR